MTISPIPLDRIACRAPAALLLAAALTACAGDPAPDHAPADSVAAMDLVAPEYVRLVLALGEHDADYVDAYYGPPEWREEVRAHPPDLESIGAEARALIERLAALPEPEDEPARLRWRFLVRQLEALTARVAMLGGQRLSFDEESHALYDAVAPRHGAEHFEAILAELDGRLPGDGPLTARYDAWQQGFVIPADKLDAVFQAAISACRERTLEHLELPAGESFEVEYVTGKTWSAYNWYQGGYHSLIQVNTDLPITIDRAIDLACHEGYPGHHVYNALLEEELARGRGWVEFTVYPLFSPQSLIAEGTANFGIQMAFPGEQRARFEAETLFPLAGIDPARAGEYYEIYGLREGLAHAGNEAARRYLDGEIAAAEAADWLERYALMPRPRAEQRVGFIDQYRAYVINYNLGQDLVRDYIEALGGTPDHPERRWELFTGLLTAPRTPSGIVGATERTETG
jgi:hypothetical protein